MASNVAKSQFTHGVRRQSNTTNTVEPGSIIQHGWGVFATGVEASKSETVTFPKAFVTLPIVVIAFGGDDTAGSTTYGVGGNEDKGPVAIKAHTITATNFVAHAHTSDGTNWSEATTVFYQWIAIGEQA